MPDQEIKSVAKMKTTLVKYFGKLPGQSLQDISAEMKPLTEIDVIQLHNGIEDGTLTY